MSELSSDHGSIASQEAAYHQGLFRRSDVLPAGGRTEGRVTLADTMLGLAALAPCFALLRESTLLGVASLVLLFPTLMRTQVMMSLRRSDLEPPNVGDWLAAFSSSLIRVGAVLGMIALVQALSVVLGCFMAGWIARRYTTLGGIFGFCLLGTPLSAVILIYLAPRFLAIRYRES